MEIELSPKKHNWVFDVDDFVRKSRLETHFLLKGVHKIRVDFLH